MFVIILALEDIALRINALKCTDAHRLGRILHALEVEDWPLLAMLLGVKVMHISERDTQISSTPKKVNEFVNTWSCEGIYEEGKAPLHFRKKKIRLEINFFVFFCRFSKGVAPAEIGWGTHEKTLPPGAFQHSTGPKNQICLASKVTLM